MTLKQTGWLLLLLWLFWPGTVWAQADGRAGLVVVGEDGAVTTTCVSFPETEISGYELLSRSGLAVTSSVSGAGTAVCAIEGVGCPADDCFCACQGGDCAYWSYWLADGGEWQYARAGAGQVPVINGDVQGWTWGAGSVTSAIPPPLLAFDEICADNRPAVNSQQPTDNNQRAIINWLVPLLAVLGVGLAALWLIRWRR